MSISSALNNAASGLAASAKAVQVASTNVANAMTEGYAPRRIDLASASLASVGAGVRVAGVSRQTDPVLLGMQRDSAAADQASGTLSAFWQRAETAIGDPGSGISKALSGFETALIAATDRPDLESRLAAVANGAQDLANAIATASDTVQSLREQADAAIAHDVASLNKGLQQIDTLNAQIVKMRAAGQSTLGLEDDRQSLISTLSEIVPMREYPRADGRVTLFSSAGALLLDINPQTVAFSTTPAIDASMTAPIGLSGLTLGSRSVDTGPDGPLAGGRLAANFAIRDSTAPDVQAALDSLAGDLITRFQDPSTDPSLGAGAAGLFTEAGAALSGGVTPGLASRLAINTAVVPASGGALWRLRDGIGASTTGAVGNTSGIARLAAALDRPIAPAPGTPAGSFAQTLGATAAMISTNRNSAEETATMRAARHTDLNTQALAQGVDTDAEMQSLLRIEQAYSANARVIQTADAMIKRLLEI